MPMECFMLLKRTKNSHESLEVLLNTLKRLLRPSETLLNTLKRSQKAHDISLGKSLVPLETLQKYLATSIISKRPRKSLIYW